MEIAKGINLQNPIIQFLYEDKDSAIINEPSELFYKGVKVLNRKIIDLNDMLLNLDNDMESLKFLKNSNPAVEIYKPVNRYSFYAFL